MQLANFRKTENLHILLWLLKDLCWAAGWKVFGTFMIVPTLGVAIWLTLKMRKNFAELMHNLAVICWICANATWMIGEFYFSDGTRPLALVFFILGLTVLSIYYAGTDVRKRLRK